MNLEKLYLSDPLQRTLILSGDEARRRHQEEVSTLDIIAGMLLEGEGTGAVALNQFEIDINSFRRRTGLIFGEGKSPPNPQIRYTHKTEKALTAGREVADCLNHVATGTGHVLVAITRDERSDAVGVLQSLRVNLDNLRAMVLTILNDYPGR